MTSAIEVRVKTEPIDEQRQAFVLDRPVGGSAARRYRSRTEAAESPVAQAVLAVSGVREVEVAGNVVTVIKDSPAPWSTLEPQIEYAVSVAASHAAPAAPVAPTAAPTPSDDAIYAVVEELFRDEINPMVARHGGRVELVDVQDATVVVRMRGGCQGCGMATVTLRQGIEAALRQAVPAVRGIRDITDHSAGTNPYFKTASTA